MTGYRVAARGLRVSFSGQRALDGVDLALPSNGIVGVLGRNGAGKSTLMQVLAGFRWPEEGEVCLNARPLREDRALASGICLIREAGDFPGARRVGDVMARAAALQPAFASAVATALLADLKLSADQRLRGMSRGQRSALACAIGIAMRAPLTLLDECYLGLDAPSRRRFYDALIADYVAVPRTILLASHLLGEIESMLSHALIIDAGQVLAAGEVDEVCSGGVSVTGTIDLVEQFVAGRSVLARRVLGRTCHVTIAGPLSPAERDEAARLGFEIAVPRLEDLYIALSDDEHRRGSSVASVQHARPTGHGNVDKEYRS